MICDGSAEWPCCEYVSQRGVLKVALQFPDELLQYSVPIYRALKASAPEKEFYVMADTSYGRCASHTQSLDRSFTQKMIQLLCG